MSANGEPRLTVFGGGVEGEPKPGSLGDRANAPGSLFGLWSVSEVAKPRGIN